jgi:hypothetical protein
MYKKFSGRSMLIVLMLIILSTILLLSLVTSYANAAFIEWNRTYGGESFDFIESVITVPDGFILAGSTYSFGDGNHSDAWLIKTDREGKELWNRTYKGAFSDNMQSALQTPDGYVLLVETKIEMPGYYEPWLIKTDRDGNEVWNRTYGKTFYVGSSVAKVSDGYVIAGWSPKGRDLGWLMKVDEKGNVVWEREYKPGNIQKSGAVFNLIQETSDGFIVVGHAKIPKMLNVEDDVWVVKTDFEGNEVWNRTFGGAGEDDAYCVKPTPDGYIIAGFTSYGFKKTNAWLIKIDKEGNEVWNKTFGGKDNDYACCVEVLKDGFVIAGYTINQSKSYAWLIKTDKEGNEKWKLILRSGIATSLVKVEDGFVVAGYDYSDKSAWLVKVMERIEVQKTEQPQYQISPVQSFVLFLAGVAMVLYLLYRVLR